jgi:Iap family predicted aminopeptidase
MEENSEVKELLNQLDLVLKNTYTQDSFPASYSLKIDVINEEIGYQNYLSNILGILNVTNLICAQVVENSNTEDSLTTRETMPDYDLGYTISELISQIMHEINFKKLKIRNSLKEEILYSLLKYLEISVKGNRADWYDVNKRLSSATISILQNNKKLKSIVIDSLSHDLDLSENQDKFYKEFINFVLENTND